jgi:predicted MFS family arabinose efflux permease
MPAMDGVDSAGVPARAPGLLAPLAYHGFRFAVAGRLLAMTASAAQAVTLALLVLDATGLPSGWGAILTVQAIPQVLLILVGGVAVDRYRPLIVMAASNLVQATALVPLLALTFVGVDRIELWHLYVYAVVSGIGAAFFVPASQSLVPVLVPAAMVRSANALWLLAFHISRFVGPPIAATLAASSGHAAALAVAVLLFLVGTAILLPIRQPPSPVASRESPLTQIAEGFRVARQDPVLWTVILSAAIYNFGASGAALVGLPSLAKLTLDAGDQGVGILFGALGGGALIGVVLTSQIARLPRQGIVGAATNLGIGVALAGAGLAPSLWVAVPLLVVTGVFQSAGGVIFLTLVQTRAPAEVRGRVLALLSLSLFGLTPLAYGFGGLLGDLLGPRGILLAGAAVVGLTGVLLLLCRPIREITSG